jgi:electron transfer flavoprotein alpha subunit
MIAVLVVRDGQLPHGGDEAVAECGGRAVVVGSGTGAAAADPALAGVAKQITALEWGDVRLGAWAPALAAVLDNERCIVLPASPDGRDLAPRLAALLRRPLHAGAIAVTPDRVDLARKGSSELHQVTPAGAFVATLLPGVRGVIPDGDRRPTVETSSVASPEESTDARSIGLLPPDPATIDLGEAPRIVAGGAGLDGAPRLEQLARIGAAIGASMGATRVVTDRGWVPHARQIGTTGVVVDPALYLAFGISGAVQHTAGLGDPEHIVSVNTDAHCPMMQLADLAIVADANETLDHLEAMLTGDSA